MSTKLRPRLHPKRKKRKSQRQIWQKTWRYLYLRFIRLRGSTEAIARGLAVGVFAGMFPVFGLQMAVAVVLAAIVRANKIIAAAATWVSNPFTYLPLFAFNFQVGRWLLNSSEQSFSFEQIDTWQEITKFGANFGITLFLGCFIVGLVSGIATYFLALWLVPRLKKSRRSRRQHPL